MIKTDLIKFRSAMYDCFDIYTKERNEKTIDLYFSLLIEYNIDSLLKAMESVLRTSKFFPKPSEIIEQIEGNENVLIDNAFETAKRYWQEMGFYNNASFTDQLISETIKDIGGLQVFCESMDNDKFKGESKTWFEFNRIYSKYLRLKKEGLHKPSVGLLAGYGPLLHKTYVDNLLPDLLKIDNANKKIIDLIDNGMRLID